MKSGEKLGALFGRQREHPIKLKALMAPLGVVLASLPRADCAVARPIIAERGGKLPLCVAARYPGRLVGRPENPARRAWAPRPGNVGALLGQEPLDR